MPDANADLAQAVWFGAGEIRSFAMLHRPQAPTGQGVVVCNALGFEGLLAHRPLRHLATELAARGRTVLRIDYPGTGDAPSSDLDPTDLDACVDAVRDAVALLRSAEGCTSVALVGIRAGAACAALCAASDSGIDQMVLWAPFERGGTYVREMKALARLSGTSRPAGNPPPQPGDRLEVVGFRYDTELLASLSTVELAETLTGPNRPPLLLVERDDIGALDGLVKALQDAGREVDRRRPSGWAEFMVSDETQSELPTASLDVIVDWLCREEVAEGAGSPVPVAEADRHEVRDLVQASTYVDRGFSERAIWIGDRLFGLVTTPTPDGRATTGRHRAVVIMPNTGSVNRTGPGRLYTQLAREWAQQGLAVIRVDLGGTGDSPTDPGQPENRPYDPARVEELIDVVAWTRATLGAEEISLFGICSGAFQSFQAALIGADVNRLVMVNPAIFYLGPDQTVGTSTSKAMIATHNLWRLRFVRSQIRRALRSPRDLAQFWRRACRGIAYSIAAWARPVLRRVGIDLHDREDLAHDLQRLTAADIELVFVFATDEAGARYLRVFGGDVLVRLQAEHSVSLIEIPGGDHVFSPPVARQAMTAAVTHHLVPAGSALPPTPAPVGQG